MKYKITAESVDAHSITGIVITDIVDTAEDWLYKECKSEREVKDMYESLCSVTSQPTTVTEIEETA